MEVDNSGRTEVSVLYEDCFDFVSVYLIGVDKQSLVCKRLSLLWSVSFNSDGDSVGAGPLYESLEIIFLRDGVSPVKLDTDSAKGAARFYHLLGKTQG